MSDQWYVRIGTEIRGPLSRAQVLALLTQGLLSPEDGLASSPQGPWTAVKKLLTPPGAVETAGRASVAPTASPAPAQELPAVGPSAAPGPRRSPAPPSSPPGGALPAAHPAGPPRTSSAAPTATATGHPSAAELRLEKRRQRRLQAAVLLALFLGTLVAGTVVVLVVYQVRRWLAAGQAQAQTARKSPVSASTPTVVPTAGAEDMDQLLSSVGTLLADRPGEPSPGPAASPRWYNASTEAAQLGPFTIRVLKAEIAFARLISSTGRRVRFRDPCLLVTLEYAADESAKSAQFGGWAEAGRSGNVPTLLDQSGRALSLKRQPGFQLEGQAPPSTVAPGERLTDVLAFEAPSGPMRSLRLVLPGQPFGAKEPIGFLLPAEMIVDARPTPGAAPTAAERSERPDSLPPQAQPQTGRQISSAGAAPLPAVEDERIPIPGLEEETAEAATSENSGADRRALAEDPALRALEDRTSRQLLRQPAARRPSKER